MMLATFCRSHMQSQEPFRLTATQEALDRNPIRFCQLMDVGGAFPCGKSPAQPNVRKKTKEIPSYLSLFDDVSSNGAVQLRSGVDFHQYDLELARTINERSKGSTIRFPDVYRRKL